jgi:hypothetical protein
LRFLYRQPELEQELAEAKTIDALESVLGKIVRLPAEFRTPEIYGRQLFAKGLDELVPRIARRMRLKDLPRAEKSNDNVCVLMTRPYFTGGHSRVAADLIERIQPAGAALIMTDIYRELRYADFLGQATNQSHLKERAALILASEKLIERILEAYMMLATMRPSRIILMSHPMDIVAVVAAWPFRDVVEFVHHADHAPSVGCTLPFSAHVDLTYTCHLACREAGLDPLYAGMTAPSVASAPSPEPGTGPRIATCGSLHKYKTPGAYRWTDYVVAALRLPGAEIIHVGPTDEAFQKELRDALTAASISLDRYILADYQPSLAAELAKYRADVYLSSYPETGGKANLEAMIAGVPVIVPRDRDGPPLTHFRLPLSHWFSIEEPAELAEALERARVLRPLIESPEYRAQLARELVRFDDYAAGRRPEPTSRADALP